MRLLVAAVMVLVVGCTQKEAAAPPAPPAGLPVPSFPPSAPIAVAASPALTGKVLETLEAPSYTYLRLQTASAEQWAAIPTAAVAVGAEVTLGNPMVMTNFVSKTLKRTFPEIFFCSGVESGPSPHVAPSVAEKELLAWARQGTPQKVAPIDKGTSPDARTVAEIYLQRAALTDKPVLLKGKVVKVTNGVLGKNWIHLQDGSGSVQGKDNDIAVTLSEVVAMGDVVAVRGAVHVDRDFGSGYVFPVMIENATVVR